MHIIYSGLLFIDSSQRTSGTSSSFDILLNQEVPMDSLKLQSVTIPNTFYNITSSNNSFTVTEGANTVSVSLTPGLYSINTLLTLLGTALTDNATLTGTYTCTLDSITQYVTISCTTNFTVISTGALARQLGFVNATAQAGTEVATELYDLSSLREVYIQVTNIPVSSLFNSGVRNIIGKVPLVGAQFGEIVYHSYDSEATMINFVSTELVDTIGISLVDSSGNLMDNLGIEWSLEFVFTRRDPNDTIANKIM